MIFEKALKKFLITEPFYGLFLTTINKEKTDSIKTLGVSLKGTDLWLHWNEDFWNTLTDLEQLAVLKHECLHIVFKHLTDFSDLTDKTLANIAMDAEINSYISNLPENAVTGEKIQQEFTDFKLMQGTRYNYQFLSEHRPQMQMMQGFSSNGGSSSEKERENNSGIGQCLDEHNWEEAKRGVDPQALQETVMSKLRAAYESSGELPGELPGELKEALTNPFGVLHHAFNWRKYFRNILGQSEHFTRKKTRKKSSKRFEESAGTKQRRHSSVLVAVDTSGSVSQSLLEGAFAELKHIQKAGTEVHYTCFDTQCYDVNIFSGKPVLEYQGGGGTDFDAPIEYFNKHRQYDRLVIITDGYASWTHTPRYQHCVWLVDGKEQNYPGVTIYTNKQ